MATVNKDIRKYHIQGYYGDVYVEVTPYRHGDYPPTVDIQIERPNGQISSDKLNFKQARQLAEFILNNIE